MQIVDVETFVLKVPAEEAYLGRLLDGSRLPTGYTVRPPWRSLYSEKYETVLVKITAENGVSGWGEALAPVAPEVPAAIIDRLLNPVLIGSDALKPRPNWVSLSNLMRERGHLVGHQADALAAVDIALWDLFGKLSGRSVAELLGGTFRIQIPTYVSGLPRPSDPERGELAAEWQHRGAKIVKLHLGHGVEADLETVAAIQVAAPALQIAVDAHWAYSFSEARVLADGLAARGVSFLEAPLAPEDEDSHAQLCAQARLPIAVGEMLRNRYEFSRWLSTRALHIAQPDVGRTGITEAMAIGELCAAHHVPVAPHHSVGLGIVLAAGLHVSASLQGFKIFEYQPTSTAVGSQILSSTIVTHADHFELPSGPGLGIEVNEEIVRNIHKESQY